MYDLWEWEQYLNGSLSTVEVDDSTENVSILLDPIACISGPAGAAGRYTIAIAWRSTKPVGAPDIENLTADDCGEDLGDDRHIYWVDAYLSAN
ncbi:MAG: hypothetical protein M5U09_02475 [Gammaproteobacteria bacterium]|nr:hypothetical protein [Gammaproteobacteria bacterium]